MPPRVRSTRRSCRCSASAISIPSSITCAASGAKWRSRARVAELTAQDRRIAGCGWARGRAGNALRLAEKYGATRPGTRLPTTRSPLRSSVGSPRSTTTRATASASNRSADQKLAEKARAARAAAAGVAESWDRLVLGKVQRSRARRRCSTRRHRATRSTARRAAGRSRATTSPRTWRRSSKTLASVRARWGEWESAAAALDAALETVRGLAARSSPAERRHRGGAGRRAEAFATTEPGAGLAGTGGATPPDLAALDQLVDSVERLVRRGRGRARLAGSDRERAPRPPRRPCSAPMPTSGARPPYIVSPACGRSSAPSGARSRHPP